MTLIAPILLEWYDRYGRDLPWRTTHDPYRIWLSEVILQQTRVKQGLAYYERFTEQFPTVEDLAAATEDEVLKCWQGLGYYSRARNLHAAAQQVVTEFGGQFPTSCEALRKLHGVGDYTAAAVASFAAGEPCAVVDGNVYRVLSRLFDLDLPIDSTAGKKAFAELAAEQLDRQQPGRYNQAIMDFGALQCTPTAPRCTECPLADRCLAHAAGTIGERPTKQGRTQQRDRYFHFLHIECNGQTLLHRREEGDIWQGLYEFPLIETAQSAEFEQIASDERFVALLGGTSWRLTQCVPMPLHQLSHQRIHACFYHLQTDRIAPNDYRSIATEQIGEYAVARLTERYLIKYHK